DHVTDQRPDDDLQPVGHGRNLPRGERSERRRARVESRQPPETSRGLALPWPIHGIIERSCSPTSSIWCSAALRRSALYTGRPAWFSRIHSWANLPPWISPRILRISARVSSVMMRGPRVRSPYSAVSLIE